MCLGIPGRVISINGEPALTRSGRVDFGGIIKDVCLAYTPEARIGDYVIVHVGFAISVVNEAEAARVFAYLRELDNLETFRREVTP